MPELSALAKSSPSSPQPFMQSRRVRAGRADTQFFWIERDGHPCVAKQLSQELGPQVADLLVHERQVLRLLNTEHAPVCQLVEDDAHPDWLVTRFAGLSLQVLGQGNQGGWPALPLRERVSVWANFLRRAQVLADLGAVPLDLSDRNLVVPIGPSGHLDLSAAVSIDHAHTVLPSSKLEGGALSRPVWIGAKHNRQLAPEVRTCLERDQQRFLNLLKEKNAPMLGTTPAVDDEEQVTHRLWLAYKEPQDVQKTVDVGDIVADKAIQYAVGYAIHRHLTADDPLTPALAAVVQCLCADQPGQRYGKLEDASHALIAAIGGGGPALSSAHIYQPRLPEDLRPPLTESTAPLLNLNKLSPKNTQGFREAAPHLGEGSTFMVEGEAASGPTPIPSAPPMPTAPPAPALAAGTEVKVTVPTRPDRAPGWRYAVAALLALVIGWPLGQWLGTLSAG